MCGIAGYSGDFERALLVRMSDVLAHRGPDADGLLELKQDGVGLAHRRLAIIDLSPLGRQPMWDHSGKAAIVYNGEIYNYKELREALVEAGFKFRSSSDTEVILNLYLRHGADFLRLLNGIFAFAIWDSRDRTLLLARDGFGVKPLYYAECGEGFLFASEMKAILQAEDVPRELDHSAVFSYLTYLWAPAPATMLTGIRKLEPGSALHVRDGQIVQRWKYYDFPCPASKPRWNEAEATEQVADTLRQAVKRQMVADVPVGAFLSGGLDSSAIVALANGMTDGRRLQCFTIRDPSGSQEGFADDFPFAQRAAAHLGVDLHIVDIDPGIADHVERMVYHLDEPQGDFAPINVFLIAKLAREHGIKVLLSGSGGDDLFAGYRRHFAVAHEKLWTWLPSPALKGASALAKGLPPRLPFLRRLGKLLQYAHLEGDARLISYFRWASEDALRDLIVPDRRGAFDAYCAAPPLMESLRHLDGADPLDRMLYLEQRHFLADHNLNYTDKMAMAAGVEVRVPFLDPDLMTLAASLPQRLKQRGRVGKWVLKQAAQRYLPGDIIYRPKTGFGAPVRTWLNNQLKDMVRDVLSRDAVTRRGLFDSDAVERLIQDDQAGRVDAAYIILELVCMELWCRKFLGASGRE